MNLKNKPPIFVPEKYQREIEHLSKAALMDMVWDYAMLNGAHVDDEATMKEFRARRDIILIHRARA